MPKLHYIWVGDACTTNLDDPQNDLVGPVAMEKVIDHNTHCILYWCFESEKKRYQTLLAGKKIQVRSFYDCFRECCDIDMLVNQTLNLIRLNTKLFLSSGRSQVREHVIRDYVTFKEAMSLFLLYAYGGYAMDTNVVPVPSVEQIEFPEPINFCMMGLSHPVKKMRDADVGVMCASLANREHAGKALDIFLENINTVEEARATCIAEKHIIEEFFSEYKQIILDYIIDSALHGIRNARPETLSFFETETLGDNFPVVLTDLQIIKHYANSHGAMDRKIIPPLLLAVSTGDIKKVEAMLLRKTQAFNINETFDTDKYRHITAYSVACFYRYSDIVALLLEHGADQSIKQTLILVGSRPTVLDAGFFSKDLALQKECLDINGTTSAAAAPPPAL